MNYPHLHDATTANFSLNAKKTGLPCLPRLHYILLQYCTFYNTCGSFAYLTHAPPGFMPGSAVQGCLLRLQNCAVPHLTPPCGPMHCGVPHRAGSLWDTDAGVSHAGYGCRYFHIRNGALQILAVSSAPWQAVPEAVCLKRTFPLSRRTLRCRRTFWLWTLCLRSRTRDVFRPPWT